MKMNGPGGYLAILGALILVFGVVSHVAKFSFFTIGGYAHPNIIVAIIGAVVLVVGLVLRSRAKK